MKNSGDPHLYICIQGLSVAELMADECEGLEPGEIDDQSVVESITSQKCEEVAAVGAHWSHF